MRVKKLALEKELTNLLSNTSWNYVGLIDTNKKIIQIPKESKVVTAILEDISIQKIVNWAKSNSIKTILPSNEREYPDLTLEHPSIGGTIALDIKTARQKTDTRISKLTLGSYAGYFRNPSKKLPGCRIPYNDFAGHWIVAFTYWWKPTEPSETMVAITNTIISEKWKLASKSSGTGTTKHIGSITNIDELKQHNGSFKTESEFEEFWRKYGD
jgi:hypothetical protein